ncbi:MAG TPA: ATP-grasp domain-containing protein [Methylocella sp.]|nr:ATP-grasp domain-containing protein [Methylocella sp.]
MTGVRVELNDVIALIAQDEWISTARLPEAFAGLGVKVVAVCKAGDPLERSRYLAASVTATSDIRSDLEWLVAEHDPAALIACDEGAVRLLYPLFDAPALSPRLRNLLRRSLGNPASHSVVTSKWATGSLAEQLNLRVPKQSRVKTPEEAMAFAEKVGYPIILKRENTYGGMGCYVCRSDQETLGNYLALGTPRKLRKLRHWPGLLAALHRLVMCRDAGAGEPLIVQRYHEGQLAFTTAVARDGVMLGGFTVVAEHIHPVPTGASTVVRAIDRPEMLQATEALIRQTQFSGFIGVDFILDRTDRLPYLLEINPRVTPACRLGRLLGFDLCGLFAANFAGLTLEHTAQRPTSVIAFFPNEWIRNWRSPYLRDAYNDVPQDDPALLAYIYQSLPLSRRIMLAIGLRGTLPPIKGNPKHWPRFALRSRTKSKT